MLADNSSVSNQNNNLDIETKRRINILENDIRLINEKITKLENSKIEYADMKSRIMEAISDLDDVKRSNNFAKSQINSSFSGERATGIENQIKKIIDEINDKNTRLQTIILEIDNNIDIITRNITTEKKLLASKNEQLRSLRNRLRNIS